MSELYNRPVIVSLRQLINVCTILQTCYCQFEAADQCLNSFLNPLYTSDSYMRTLSNSEHPDEMLHDAVFHQGLHCLLRQKLSSENE